MLRIDLGFVDNFGGSVITIDIPTATLTLGSAAIGAYVGSVVGGPAGTAIGAVVGASVGRIAAAGPLEYCRITILGNRQMEAAFSYSPHLLTEGAAV
ncbi:MULTISPECIES: hypothetical protein [Calothrix]|uniref:Glycine zipper domain-containing protein n=2 Tax=Calothrix TaxID=1186 RepID=A0ABR8A660_9CYAN|nr:MULTISPECIES: hypothetical protein [Calothrix]MBD2195477.1 hypothetical protein [Calothrix parietina FACHB-288]MBD2223139.1 hypothetical protein [Calothrix anomala FACHB-343]